jgi:hypothetical protein
VSDFTLQPQHTGVVGMTGSGKTTFVNRYLLNDDSAACRFLYDDLNRMWPRLKLSPCYSPGDLEGSLASRWSAFVPLRMLHHFKGDTKLAFRWWCKWVFSAASRGPGKKMVVIPEVWRHCNEDSIPMELATLLQAGRELGIECVVDTQRPEKLNGSIVGALTELVCFRQMSGEAMKATERMLYDAGIVPDRAALTALPLGSFIGFNRLSGGRLAGRVF